ncbi:CRISPR-associated endoribonuclease Cas6 [Streptomyces specialis]|uniref:CRISPR-associated endoribonuclease Cas6 n=1 Tax=Streptomyces specialis TaxID=498367 RepID=UPI001F4114D1|nr:CRISPR-associated endoribonuclease Cas6 [Streptomyces specialis]
MYGLLGSEDAALARALHDEGWNGHQLRPLGLTAPQFRGAPRKGGAYTTSRDGSLWFGSPVPQIAAVLVKALASRSEILWGKARLRVRGFMLDVDTPAGDGPVELATATPVVVKYQSRYLLPGDERYIECLQHNLAHKADVLGLPVPRDLRVVEAGPRRRFTVRGAPRIGAQVRVSMESDDRFVQALRSWGLGLDTIQGFGWIR